MSDSTTDVDTTTPRRPGRPRSAQADRAIADAALQVLVEQGYEGMSIEAVAARAGVGKTTIYRRWPGKEGLIADALRSIDAGVEIADTGNTRDDLLLTVHEFRRRALGSVIGPMISRLVSAALTNPDLRPIFMNAVFNPRRAAARMIIERGIARGELRDNLDIDLTLDSIAGPMLYSVIFNEGESIRSPGFPERLVDQLMRGIGASDLSR